MPKRILVTGGAGFIGSALVRRLVSSGKYDVLNIDKLTYAGSLGTIESVMSNQQHQFIRGDICDADKLRGLFASFRPNIVTHLAAESHVDRSIDGPAPFMETNIMGTYTLLEEVRAYFYNLDGVEKDEFRFHHISTDEVYSSLGRDGFLPRIRLMIHVHHTRRPRRVPTIWFAPGVILLGCLSLLQTVQTIMVLISFPRN